MEIINYKGIHWSARKADHIYIVSLDNHSNIVVTLTDFIQNQNIQAGEVTGIGAVSEATLLSFNPSTKKYVDKTFKEQMDLLQQEDICNINIGLTFIFILLKSDIALRKYFIQNHL